MQVRKIFYLLALSLALQPCTSDAWFEKWSNRELLLSLYGVVVTVTLVSVLYRNWSHKTEKQNSVIKQKQTKKKIEEKIVPKVVPEKPMPENSKQTQVLNSKPEENADIELQNVVEQYAPASEPTLKAEQIWTSKNNGVLENTEKSHVNFILFKLKENNKPALIDFINKPYLNISERVPFETHPQACVSGNREMVNRFARFFQGNYYYAANLLLSTGLLDTKQKYGCYRDTRSNDVEATNSFFGWLMWLSKGFTGGGVSGDQIDPDVMTEVMGSHGAKTFNWGKGETEVVQNGGNKIIIKPIPEYKEKRFFSPDGKKTVDKATFVNDLKEFLQK